MTVVDHPGAEVIWHELECGSYRQDLLVWRSLAARHGGPVLEIGAGTGRVALDLAAAGHKVTALERDASLLAELARRTGDLLVTPVHADARRFHLEERFALCIVPMQTIQLLGGAVGRRAFLRCARHHLRDDGVLAMAIVETLQLFRAGDISSTAEACERDGVLYSSRPTAILADTSGFVLERRRETTAATGEHTVLDDSVHLDRLTRAKLEAEAVSAGLRPLGRASVLATPHHTGSEVVIVGA